MLANAHKDPGPDGLKIFNIGYLAGIAGLLIAWNSIILIKVTVSDHYIGFTALCLKKTFESKPFYPIIIVLVILLLCIIFAVIITRRTYKYLYKLQDSHLHNLPAKNVLTYIDTLILFSLISGSCMIMLILVLSFQLDILSFENVNLATCIISLILDDIVVGFIFPIYIIIKTKRYLPKLWDDSRPLVGGNNDFFSTNPATVAVAPAPGPQPVNHQIDETAF